MRKIAQSIPWLTAAERAKFEVERVLHPFLISRLLLT